MEKFTHSQETLKTRPWLNADDTHKNKNCLYYMSKANAIRVNCIKKGSMSREFCTLDCEFRCIK